MSSNIKVFKLTYSGKFIELSNENELDYFNLFDIIAVFVASQKRMYVWIAKKAAQSLKNLIPQIRHIFSEEYPELIILRNITIDAGNEPSEFFEVMGFTKEDLIQHLRNVETKLLPIISEINRLKSDVDQYFILKDYEKAIFQANKIIALAQKIADESLENDQKDFIKVAQIKAKAKEKLKEIEENCVSIINEFEKRIEDEDFRGAHNIVDEFKLKYEKEYNLMSIPLAKQIILMDNNLVDSISKEVNRIKVELIKLNKKFETYISNEKLGKIPKILNQAKALIEQVEDSELEQTWLLIEDRYRKKKKVFKNSIVEMTQKVIGELKESNLSYMVKVYENIINKLETAFKEQSFS